MINIEKTLNRTFTKIFFIQSNGFGETNIVQLCFFLTIDRGAQ